MRAFPRISAALIAIALFASPAAAQYVPAQAMKFGVLASSSAQALVDPGTGYAVGDVIVINGGDAAATPAQITVLTALSTGAISTYQVTTPGAYSVLPAVPAQGHTTGSGTGAKFNLLFGTVAATLPGGSVTGDLYVSGTLGVGVTAKPTIDMVVRDVNGDSRVEARLERDASDFTAFYLFSDQAFWEVQRATGAAVADISPKPLDLSSNAQITLFRNSTTSGSSDVVVHKGDGTNNPNAQISGKGNSYFSALAGSVGIGTASPLSLLHLQNSTADEKLRITDTVGGTALGLSLGYDDASNTSAYQYNRYSGNAASAMYFGFGSSYASGRVLSLFQSGRAAFAGHVENSGTAPALTSCGTSPAISGSDMAGEVTMGTASPTGCVITFATAYAAAPYCNVTWQATPLASQSYTVSTTAITLVQTATSSNKVNYHCTARSGG